MEEYIGKNVGRCFREVFQPAEARSLHEYNILWWLFFQGKGMLPTFWLYGCDNDIAQQFHEPWRRAVTIALLREEEHRGFRLQQRGTAWISTRNDVDLDLPGTFSSIIEELFVVGRIKLCALVCRSCHNDVVYVLLLHELPHKGHHVHWKLDVWVGELIVPIVIIQLQVFQCENIMIEKLCFADK